MNKVRYVVFLRDEIGLSFRQIAKIVEGRDDSKTILKVYGWYRTVKDNESKGKMITTTSMITQNIQHYVKTKVHESHEPLYLGDLRKRRLELARQLKYTKDEQRRKEIYREINKTKLLELLIIVYDLVGLSQYDRDRMILMTIYNVGRKLVDRVPLEKDHVKWRRTGIDHLSEYAAAYLYIVYFVTLYNTRYQYFLEKVQNIIYTIMKGRSLEKKLVKIQRIIQDVYGDIIPKILLRI